ncbi:MAG TPA: hypothetical protein VIM60_10305 [Edaphobacter sp.]
MSCVAVLGAAVSAAAQSGGGEQRLSPQDVQIVAETAKQAAYAYSLGTWCTAKNRNGLQQYAGAVAGWIQRNHWKELEAGPVKTELAPGEYDGLKAEALKDLNAHSFKTVFACAAIANVLRQPEHDPSQRYGAELSRIAAASVPAVEAGTNTQTAANAAPPMTQQSAPVNSAVVAGTQQSTQLGAATGATGSVQQSASAQSVAAQQAVTTSVAAGAPLKIGDASLMPVAGWAVTKSAPDQVILQKTMLEKGTRDAKFIVLLSMQPMQGSIDQAFPAAVRRSFPGPPLELKYVSKGVTRGGQQARTVRDGGRMNLPGNPRARVRAVGVAAPDGRLFLAMILMRSEWETLMGRGDDEFEAMLTSLRFDSQPESSLWDFSRPPKGSGGQSGLYWANALINMPNAFGGMDLRAERYYVLLLPNGQAYSELPDGGHVDDFNFAEECRKKPKRCGTYDISGGRIHFKWMDDYGLVEESESAWMPVDNGSFTTRGHDYRRILPVHGLRVSGKYTSTFASVGTIGAQSTSVVSEKYITFTPDGRYQKSGFSGASFDNSGAAGTFASKKGVTTGTYAIDGYTLTLTPNGAQPEYYSVIFEDPSPSPKAIFIDDSGFLRNDR